LTGIGGWKFTREVTSKKEVSCQIT